MTPEEFFDRFHIDLTNQQKAAVEAVDGPVLLLAVPGSGKTTVLVTRLGYMIFVRGIAPERILTVTYTVAATRDMRERFASFFGEEMAARLEFRTINGICARIIARFSRDVGKKSFDLISDDKKSGAMLGAIYRQVTNEFATESDLAELRTRITRIKNQGLTEEEIRAMDREAGYDVYAIFSAYNKALREEGLMDYDDQLVYALNILRRSPRTLEAFRAAYPYISVDEAQDTSKIQHTIIALLAGKNDNLFMVGDEDQSIYGFRAAYPEALLRFEADHPNASVLFMETNFRSDAGIVKAADRFIRLNSLRRDKHMNASRAEAEKINLIELSGRRAQYTYLAKVAANAREETAVLYRNNESMLPLIDLLDRENVPYRVRQADLTFFTHRIVADITDILRFALNPRDTEIFQRIYYKLSTYLSRDTASEVCDLAKKRSIPVLSAALRYGKLPQGTRISCQALADALALVAEEKPDLAISTISGACGYMNYLDRMGMNTQKLFILKTLASRETDIPGFLARLDSLRDLIRNAEQDQGCNFILSTIHASKGLEYDTVYLMDVMDGIFPESVPLSKKASPAEKAAYEEERRLFYVGVTRARNRLNIFAFGKDQTFCRELLPEAFKKKSREPGRANAHLSGVHTAAKDVPEEAFARFRKSLAEGMTVRHKNLGSGYISRMDDNRVTILFGEDEKTFDLRFLFMKDLLKAED